MTRKRLWFVIILPIVFLCLMLAYAWNRDSHFYLSSEALYHRAKVAEDQGDLPQALALAKKSWDRNPGHSDCGTFLGWLYLKQGEVQPARETFRQVWEKDPKATGALKGLAQALNQEGQRQEALELLATYLKENPKDADVCLFAAQLAGQREEDRLLAVDYYQRCYRLEPTPEVRRTLVDLLTGLQRFKEAIPLQEEQAAQNPDDPEALHRLALLHYWSRDYDAATQVYQRLLTKAAENATYRREAAKAAEAAKNVDEALKHYLWLFVKSKGKKEHALPLARLWTQKGNHAEAVAVLVTVMDDQPDAETVRWYALELILTGNFDKAYKVYKKAWEGGDTHKETIVNLARLYARKRQFSRAAAMWDEAGRRQLINGELRWEAALTYSYAQKFSRAVKILKPIERNNPKYPRLLLFLGQMHFYQKHWSQAAKYFQRYLEKHPDDVMARQLLAEALSFQPQAKGEALKQYGELVKRSDDVGLRLRRVALLLKAKRWKEAEGELKECPVPQDPRLLREQARLLMWAGDMETALLRYQGYLKQEPRDREVLLEKARVLVYLGRAPEALEVLRVLRVGEKGVRLDQPGDRAVLMVSIQASLAQKDWTEALRWALRLYGSCFSEKHRLPRDWPEAHRWSQEDKKKPDRLSLEERTWVARALCHASEPEACKVGVDLAVDNLWKKRRHHPTLLILAYLLPRLPRYEDLSRMVYRIPGIKVDSPEYVATVAFFSSKLGRHGGKLDYLLHVLKQYRRRYPKSPGELMALADLAMELGDRRGAERYYRRAQKLRPDDQRLANLILQCQMTQKDWSKVLTTLKGKPATPENALEIGRVYLMRGQYEGVKAAAAQIPERHPDYARAQLLKVQACRLQKSYPEALQTLEPLAGRLTRQEFLMEKGRILEGMGDRTAMALYTEVMQSSPDSKIAHVAEARRARASGNAAGARKAFALALQEAPQDVELLNEFEEVRQRMRPQLASRSFPHPHGERRPEETMRPYQFSRVDREIFGGLPRPRVIPVIQPETMWFRDSNRLYGWILRATAGFWVKKVVPVHVAVEYREYRQNSISQNQGPVNLGLDRVDAQVATDKTRLRRADLTLGVGPVNLANRLKISGELILRRYWKRVDRDIFQKGAKWIPLPPPPALVNRATATRVTKRDDRDRLLGTVQLDFPMGLKTDGTLRYARRDLFDVEPYLFPRLYQSVNNLGDVPLITYHQMEFSFTHQFRPNLKWRGNIAGALFSDRNSRVTLYQGLTWEPIKDSRMKLGLTPHYYLTAYREHKDNYFSPLSYNAIGLTVDFQKQIYRLPTLILQGSA